RRGTRPALPPGRPDHPRAADHTGGDMELLTSPNGNGEPDESPYSPGTTAVLDRAAEYEDEYALHEGAVAFREENPGDFWSIRVADCYKAFGRAEILRGVSLGVPEGMVTVILGPSGT